MVYGYIRVSTDKQTVENQRLAIETFCKSKGIEIDVWISETISGMVNFRKRKLGELFSRLRKGDYVYITEISRFERNVFSVFNMVLELLKKEVHVYSILEDMEIEDTSDCAMKIFSTAYSAQAEREKLVERTKLGLARARAEGKKVGRAPGEKNHNYKLDRWNHLIVNWLNEGRSLSYITRKLQVGFITVKRYVNNRHLVDENSPYYDPNI